MAVSPGTEIPSRSEALNTCTRCPLALSPLTRCPNVMATPFTSGSYVSVATSILMRRYHERENPFKQAAERNETVTGRRPFPWHKQANNRTRPIPEERPLAPLLCSLHPQKGKTEALSAFLFHGQRRQTHSYLKSDHSLYIKYFTNTCVLLPMIKPSSTSFFKKYNDFHHPEKCKKSFLDPLHEIFLFLKTFEDMSSITDRFHPSLPATSHEPFYPFLCARTKNR